MTETTYITGSRNITLELTAVYWYTGCPRKKDQYSEATILIVPNKGVYIDMYPIPNGFQCRAISLCSNTLYTEHSTDEQRAMFSH
jgi:ABC-type amino acid transport system permease subunit